MTAAALASVWRTGVASTTARHFGRALALALAAVGAGLLIYVVETCLLRAERRLVENPSATVMRAVGLAHFWVGWLFLFTSPAVRSPWALGRLALLTAGGAGLCVLCAHTGAARSPLTFVLFYGYFLVHEMLDEAKLYRANGDAPEEGRAGQRAAAALTRAAVLCLLTTLAAGYLLYAHARGRAETAGEAPLWLGGAAAALAVASAWAVSRAVRLGREAHGSAAALLGAHAPLMVVYGTLGAILVVGVLAGSFAFNLIILIHVASWFVFVYAKLRDRPAPAGRGLWAWLRGTPAGFAALHLAVVVLILVLMGLRVHVWERSGWVSQALAASSFPYWSLMHITMAFWRR